MIRARGTRERASGIPWIRPIHSHSAFSFHLPPTSPSILDPRLPAPLPPPSSRPHPTPISPVKHPSPRSDKQPAVIARPHSRVLLPAPSPPNRQTLANHASTCLKSLLVQIQNPLVAHRAS